MCSRYAARGEGVDDGEGEFDGEVDGELDGDGDGDIMEHLEHVVGGIRVFAQFVIRVQIWLEKPAETSSSEFP